jgi:hypothetical protein
MPLQTSQLRMVALGVEQDVPPNDLQPRLADGIHLRWSPAPALGLPWYGFYLYRHEHPSDEDGAAEGAPMGAVGRLMNVVASWMRRRTHGAGVRRARHAAGCGGAWPPGDAASRLAAQRAWLRRMRSSRSERKA